MMSDLAEYKSMGISTQTCESLGVDSNPSTQEPRGGSKDEETSCWSFSTFSTLVHFPIKRPFLTFLILVLDKQRIIYNLLTTLCAHTLLIQDILLPHVTSNAGL